MAKQTAKSSVENQGPLPTKEALRILNLHLVRGAWLQQQAFDRDNYEIWRHATAESIKQVFGADSGHIKHFLEPSKIWAFSERTDLDAIARGALPTQVKRLSGIIDQFTQTAAIKAHSLSNRDPESSPSEIRIFIGHGRSLVWHQLKSFLESELRLPCDEFNRISPVGMSIKDRLSAMLNEASFAFLIMTAEDELAGGGSHARLNVVHELGLF